MLEQVHVWLPRVLKMVTCLMHLIPSNITLNQVSPCFEATDCVPKSKSIALSGPLFHAVTEFSAATGIISFGKRLRSEAEGQMINQGSHCTIDYDYCGTAFVLAGLLAYNLNNQFILIFEVKPTKTENYVRTESY